MHYYCYMHIYKIYIRMYLGDHKSESNKCVVGCFGLGSFLRAFGLVDAFRIGLSASMGGLGSL